MVNTSVLKYFLLMMYTLLSQRHGATEKEIAELVTSERERLRSGRMYQAQEAHLAVSGGAAHFDGRLLLHQTCHFPCSSSALICFF